MKKIVISLIFVIVLVGGYYLYTNDGFDSNLFKKSPEEAPVIDENLVQNSNNQSLLSSIGENVVLIVEQPPAVEIMAHGVKLSNPGWLVIRNQASEIVGFVGVIPKGEFKNIKVTMNELYPSGSAFSAMLQFDDGDGIFNPEKDLPVSDSAGNIVLMQFRFNDKAPNPEDLPLIQ